MDSQGWDEAPHVHSQLACSLVDQSARSVEELQLESLVLIPAAACINPWYRQGMRLARLKEVDAKPQQPSQSARNLLGDEMGRRGQKAAESSLLQIGKTR